MAGPKDGLARLARNLKAEIDEERIEAYRGTVSLPFAPGEHRRIAVKIVDDRRHRESEGDGGGRMKAKIAIPEEAIRDFCRRWQVREFTLFGSVLRDDFGADSDIDVLISFRPETQRGFTQLAAMRKELEKLWGRRVDLVDRRLVEASENYIRRRHILKHAETVYVELPSLMATLEPFIPPDEED